MMVVDMSTRPAGGVVRWSAVSEREHRALREAAEHELVVGDVEACLQHLQEAEHLRACGRQAVGDLGGAIARLAAGELHLELREIEKPPRARAAKAGELERRLGEHEPDRRVEQRREADEIVTRRAEAVKQHDGQRSIADDARGEAGEIEALRGHAARVHAQGGGTDTTNT